MCACGGSGSGTDTGTAADSGAGASSAGAGAPADPVTYGASHEGGQFHLGPVDWDETQWHNACAPGGKYAPAIRKLEGTLLAGLWSGIADVAQYCDACIAVTTARGKSAVLRVVTYGDTTPNSLDVSPQAYALLDSGEYPRAMSWQFTRCPNGEPIVYEFQSGSSEWWTSLWVRNARLPITKLEVKSAKHDFLPLVRGSDGTLTDAGGFGKGPFSLRLTAMDGQQYVDDFNWPSAGLAGQTLTGHGNFP